MVDDEEEEGSTLKMAHTSRYGVTLKLSVAGLDGVDGSETSTSSSDKSDEATTVRLDNDDIDECDSAPTVDAFIVSINDSDGGC